MRVFVAIPVDPRLGEAIAGLRRRLNSAADALRWVPPENLHLTLKFLGEIASGRAARVVEGAREVARRKGPFTITLAGMGAFPSTRRPQVVWVGVERGADDLQALARDLETTLRRMKFPREPRPFRPHLTVARAKHSGPPPDLSETLGTLAGAPVGSQAVETLVVMESMLRPSGAIHRPVEEVWLGERAGFAG